MSLEIQDVETGLPSRADLAVRPRTFRMGPEYRRSAIYILVGLALIPLVRWGLRDYLPARGPNSQVLGLCLCSLLAFGPIGILRWRLRVDEAGIARRRFFRWDLWPWEAFNGARVRDAEDDSTAYILPEKPSWARKLSIGLLDEEARELVAGIIDRERVRPEAPAVPNELHVRYPFRREAFISRSGLVLLRRGEATRYSWDDVRILRIRRRTHDRRDFSSIELVLPDQTVTFRIFHQNGQVTRSWSAPRGEPSATPDVLAEALRRYVPEDRVVVSAMSGSPRSIAEWQDRHAMFDRQGRDFVVLWRILWGAGALFIIMVLYDFLDRGGYAAVGMLGLFAVQWGLIWALVRYMERRHRESAAELEVQVPDEWRNPL
jgi:hypothetical protein